MTDDGLSHPIAIVSSDSERCAGLVGLLAGIVGGPVECPDPDTWHPQATSRRLITVVDYDVLAPSVRARVATEIRRSSPGSYILCTAGHADLADLCARGMVSNIVAWWDTVDGEDLVATVRKLLSGDIFGLEHYFGSLTRGGQATLTSSEDRMDVFDALESFATAQAVPTRFARRFVTLADELATNAFYNAPVTRDGHRTFASRSRREHVRLRPRAATSIRWMFDGRRLGLGVTDAYGSLRPYEVCASLARHFRPELRHARLGPGGAGLGLLTVFDSAHRFVCNVEPEVRTEIICTLDVDRPYREAVRRPKSFHMFVAHARRPVSDRTRAQMRR